MNSMVTPSYNKYNKLFYKYENFSNSIILNNNNPEVKRMST